MEVDKNISKKFCGKMRYLFDKTYSEQLPGKRCKTNCITWHFVMPTKLCLANLSYPSVVDTLDFSSILFEVAKKADKNNTALHMACNSLALLFICAGHCLVYGKNLKRRLVFSTVELD